MATKANPVPAVMSMAEIIKLSQQEAVSLFAQKTVETSSAFRTCAKLIIHIEAKLLPSQTVFGLLQKKGIRKSTIANASQAARVWEQLVTRELVTEKQFDKLSYADFVAVNSAIKTKGVHVVGALVAKGDLEEVEFIADYKMTAAEKKAEDAKKPKPAPEPAKEPDKAPERTPDGEKVTTLTEPPKKDVTTLETPEPQPEPLQMSPVATEELTPEVSNIVEMKPAKPGFADGRTAIATLEAVLSGDLSDDEFLTLSAELIALANLVVEKEVVIRGKKATKAA